MCAMFLDKKSCLGRITCEHDVRGLQCVQEQTLVGLLMVLLACLIPATLCQAEVYDFKAQEMIKKLYSALFETMVLRCAGNSPFNVILQFIVHFLSLIN